MTIKRLQRYQVDTCFSMRDDKGGYCLTDDVTELEATNAELVKALEEAAKLISTMNENALSLQVTNVVDRSYFTRVSAILASAKGRIRWN